MTRMRILAGAVAAAAAVATALPAAAIVGGQPDGNGHPEVGALLADVAYSDGTWAYCSGTLVSPTVLVTAAHCGEPGQTTARVTFDSQYVAGRSKVYVGTYIPNPDYSVAQSDPHDVAVVVFAKKIGGITPAQLPSAGLLDQRLQDGSLQTSAFTSVGYGAISGNNQGGKVYTDTRMVSSGAFKLLSASWLRLDQNAAHGNGGTCNGDSGGPNYLGDASSHLLVAETTTGDGACASTNVDYRLDTASARAFLGQYVVLP
jgi:secreted trypsin-like serine protease